MKYKNVRRNINDTKAESSFGLEKKYLECLDWNFVYTVKFALLKHKVLLKGRVFQQRIRLLI